MDGYKLSPLDQCCLWRLLGIEWYWFVSEVRQTNQPLSLSFPRPSKHCVSLCLSVFWHIARLDDSADAKKILTALLQEDWKRPLDHMDEDSPK